MKDLTHTTGLLGGLPPSETLGSLVKSIELQKQGVEVFLLSVGEPDFDTPRASKEACADARLVVENVPEKLELKQEVFRRLDEVCPPDCLLTGVSAVPAHI